MPRKGPGKQPLSLERARQTLGHMQSKIEDVLRAAELAVPALGEEFGLILGQQMTILQASGRAGLENARQEVALAGRVLERLIAEIGKITGGLAQGGKAVAVKAKRGRSGRKAKAAGKKGRGAAGKPRPDQKPLSEALVEILKNGKGPMKAGEMAAILVSNGYQSSSKNFTTVVQTRLSVDKKFKRDPKGGYRLD